MNLNPTTINNHQNFYHDAVKIKPIISEENVDPKLDLILNSYEDDDVQCIEDIMQTVNEEIQIISDSDSDSDIELVSELRNGKLLTYNRTEKNLLCELPENGESHPVQKNGNILQEAVAPDIGKNDVAESPKSEKGDSAASGTDISDFPESSDDYTDDDMECDEDDSNDFYQQMPITVGPLPSMPLYDTEFNLLQEIVPFKPKEEVISEGEADTKSTQKKSRLFDSESDSNDSLDELKRKADDKAVYPEVSRRSNGKKFKYWAAMAKRPIDRGEIPEKEMQAILKEEENLKKKTKSAEDQSEDSEEEDSGKEDANRNGLDFFEDNVQFQIGITTSSRLLIVKDEAVFLEYEACIKHLQQIIQIAPSFHKYELYLLLFPLIAVTYLQMMASDNFPKARIFLNRFTSQLDDSFSPRLSKLLNICRPADVPHRARKLLAGFEKLELHMSGGAYNQLLNHMQDWTLAEQNKVLTHFQIRRYSENDEPKQRFGPGQPLLEIVYWAPPDPLHKKEFSTRPLLRSRRRKNCSLPERNIHLPPIGKIYTPTPKRMDLLRRKTDEQYRKKLDRHNLPSAYMYTTRNGEEVVTCATFSESIGMLAVGTLGSCIHIFSLNPSKLVQLKSANWLKALDTGTPGIDKAMLDPTKKYSRRSLRGHQGAVYRLSFNPEDRYMLSCSEDCSVRLWCLMSWNCMVIYPGHLSPVCCVTYAPMGYYFATASDDCTARIWVQDNKRPVRILKGHLAELEVCLFHPNRHYLATGSADATVRLWDLPKGTQVRVFAGHKGRITVLAFSLCGRYLVSGGDDSLIMIWDIANERLVHFMNHHKSTINTIQFCLDNNLLMVGGQDCQLTIWDFKKILHNIKSTRNRGGLKHSGSLKSKDFLLKSYYSKDTPFYTIRITRRNLLLAFCVAEPVTQPHILKARARREFAKRRVEDIDEWMEFLNLIKMKAVMTG
ncbi:transcription initiation factor TFIID subunit 5 isoform X2 [Drosophila serrata]|uniref:transcription initiation factor TFIID subunit 5 isoform X2 n=1 Tax=Drosophila serrata TaxID=7274 RepID=UPI000A1D31FC|nr:transcription initiation factor TFIID subunit 5 isoform X2 [Drosophila serrata]